MDILGVYSPRGCGLSDLCYILRICVTKAIVRTCRWGIYGVQSSRICSAIFYCSCPMKCITDDVISEIRAVQFHQNVIKLGRALRPNLISRNSHMTTLPIATPPINKASRNRGV